jgi:pimeloyl-ACP methyl ester carboxylesterase
VPFATNDDVSLYYESVGDGADTVVFVGDVGFGSWQWGWQHRAVVGPFESVVFDHRGVGRSDTPPGPYSVDDLTGDLSAVLAAAGVSRAHLVGAGLGGVVSLALAHDSGRVRSLTLVGTGFAGDPMDAFAAPDDEAALRASTERLLSDAFRVEQTEVVDQIVTWRSQGDAPERVWRAQTAALEGYEPPPLYEVTTPTLVVHGEADLQWPVADARDLAEGLPRGAYVGYPDAAHLVGVERSRPVNDRLVGQVESHSDSRSTT